GATRLLREPFTALCKQFTSRPGHFTANRDNTLLPQPFPGYSRITQANSTTITSGRGAPRTARMTKIARSPDTTQPETYIAALSKGDYAKDCRIVHVCNLDHDGIGLCARSGSQPAR